jgi:hypothetical protein
LRNDLLSKDSRTPPRVVITGSFEISTDMKDS